MEDFMNTKRIILYSLIFVTSLAGCKSGEVTPQLVASYPAENQIAVYPVTPPDMIAVYNATLELEVSDVDGSVEKAVNLVNEYGGYLTSSQSWHQEGEKHTTLVLAVPVIHFDMVHRALFRLGDLVSERVSGELKPSGYGDDEWRTFSYITLHLHPKDSVLSALNLPDWRPAQTFTKAWRVFTSIFGFILDIIIWVGVVAGPFVLLGWLAKKLIQRRKKRSNP
jgi:hypothetical protein